MQLDLTFLPRGTKVLVACSGGADSLALLLALREQEYPCIAAHINHGTRGEESDADEQFVRQACEKLQVPFASAQLSVEPDANEAVLREARYGELSRLACEYSCPRIATGHTANDSLESILLNWLRGASVSGLAGIPPQRDLARDLLLVRPVLKVSRQAVREYLRERNWQWREDSSNKSPRYLRNRVRNELLPVLAQLAGSEERLSLQTLRASQIWRDDLELLEEVTRNELERLTLERTENLLVLDAKSFRLLAVALQRRVLRAGVVAVSEELHDLSFERVEEARLHMLANGRRAVWQWSKSLLVEWTGEHAGNRIRFKRI